MKMKCTETAQTALILLQFLCPAAAQPEPGTALWVYDTGQTIYSSPALGPDGTVYVGAGYSLYAITNHNSTVSNKWVFATSGLQLVPTLVGPEGTIFSAAGKLYAVGLDGSEKWGFGAGAGIGSPAIALDGTAYFVGTYGNLFAVAPDGTQKWALPIGTDIPRTSPSVGKNGIIYATSPNANLLYAVSPTGTVIWQSPLEGAWDSPAIADDGTIYSVGGTGLSCFTPSGTNLWSFSMGGHLGSPVIGKDGTIYFTVVLSDFPLGYYQVLFAITPAGTRRWQFQPPNLGQRYMPGTAAIDSVGTIYFAGFNTLYAVSPAGNQQWTFDAGGSSMDPSTYSYSSPAIGPDGTIYATFGSRLYAIAGTNGPGDTPWPMYRQNARRTGKVERPALTRPQKRADANFEFQLYPQQLGLAYTVESSSNLCSWTTVTSFVASTLPVDVVDLTASNAAVRFYRAFSPP
jgi:hypothetical protein